MNVKVELFFDFMLSERGVLLIDGNMPLSFWLPPKSIVETIGEVYDECMRVPMSRSFFPLSRPLVYEDSGLVLCYRIVMPAFAEWVKKGEIVKISNLGANHVAIQEKIFSFH